MAAVDEQVPLDVVRGGLDQRVHQRARMLGQAADVQHALDAAAERVPDRCSGAGERLQMLMKVFGSYDLDSSPGFEDRADTVGSHAGLGVAESRGEPDVVQQQANRRGGVHAGQNPCLAVGQRDAQRNVRGLRAEPLDDRP